jgi:uncharacterized coiled-coil DUF342 family protein
MCIYEKIGLAVRFGKHSIESSLITAGWERSEMMKRALVLISMVGLGFLFAWGASDDTSLQKAELESLKTELHQLKPNIEKAENEKSALKVKIALAEQDCNKLHEQVDELTDSRDKLQRQVEEFTFSREQSQQQLAEIIEVRDKFKKRITELVGSRDKLQEQLAELTTSRNQLRRQADELTRSRDAAVTKAQIAQERVEILLALVDSETKGIRGLQNQDEVIVTNQSKEDTQPPIIKVSDNPDVLTNISWPPVVGSQVVERPSCHSFNTTRPQILPGQTSTLSWQVSDAQSIRIEPGIGKISALGSRAVKPAATTTYTLIATNKAGERRITCRVEVGEKPAIRSQTIKRPAVLTKIIEPAVISSEVSEPPVVSSNLDGRPICHSFNTTRPRIMPGQTSTLSWQISDAQSIRIEPGIGVVSALGSRAVKPSATTTYTLIAANETGQSRISCRVEISDRITIFSSDAVHPQMLLEKYKVSEDREILSGQKPQAGDLKDTLGKFIGYRARKDEKGKFVFIPVYENKLEK